MIIASILAVTISALQWISDDTPIKEGADWFADSNASFFRADFVLPEGMSETSLEIACLGYYRLYFENRELNETPMPLWSPFNKTVYADRYELKGVKPYPATNHVYVALGNGFYNLPPLKFWGSKCFRDALAHGKPCFKVAIDGVEELKWYWRKMKIVANSPYLGTRINSIAEIDKHWHNAVVVEGTNAKILPRKAPPIVVYDTLHGNSVWLEEGKRQVIDFGVNATGIPIFSFAAKKGTEVEFLYGERLNDDGSVNVLTQAAGQIKSGNGGEGAPQVAAQRDVVIANDGETTVRIAFTWHICRYVEIRGLDTLVTNAEFRLISSDLVETELSKTFNSDDERLNRLHKICKRTFRSNLIGVQSDCPGREKLGYGGDIVATCEAMILNYDMREFYLKTLQDFADEAEDDGLITETAPYVGISDKGYGGRSGPIAWTVAVPVLIDALIRHYPDVKDRALKFYPVCARYARLIDAKFPDGIIPFCIGDHEALERAADGVNATAHWYLFAKLTASFADMLGLAEEQAEFTALAKKIRDAFIAEHVKDGIVDNGTQSAQAIALYLGLVPETEIEQAEERLIAAIVEKGFAPYTGIYSTRYMLMYLSEHNYLDVAWRIVVHEGFPGWLYMLERGASTLWETWAESDDVYSNCHPMFGSVDEWLLRFEH